MQLKALNHDTSRVPVHFMKFVAARRQGTEMTILFFTSKTPQKSIDRLVQVSVYSYAKQACMLSSTEAIESMHPQLGSALHPMQASTAATELSPILRKRLTETVCSIQNIPDSQMHDAACYQSVLVVMHAHVALLCMRMLMVRTPLIVNMIMHA